MSGVCAISSPEASVLDCFVRLGSAAAVLSELDEVVAGLADLTEAIEQLKQHGMLAKKQVTGIGPIYCVTPQASIYYHSEYCSAYSRVDVSSKQELDEINTLIEQISQMPLVDELSNQIRDKTQERNELTIEMWDRAKGGQRAAPVKDGPPSHDLLALAKDISRLKERRLKAAIDLRDLQQLAADLEGWCNENLATEE